MEAFSTPAEHAFTHPELESLPAEAGPSSMGNAVANLSIEEAFEVEDTIQRIISGGYKTIGLQFPDELLPSSVPVFRAIQKGIAGTGAQAYVLADSTYGSCCPDILSCLHLPADFLVHYGHACLTPTDALPVHYVFPRKTIDLGHAYQALSTASHDGLHGDGDGGKKKGVIVVWDVAYDWKADEITKEFSKEGSCPITCATISRPTSVSANGPASERSKEKAPALRDFSPPSGLEMEECVIWYIGEEGRGLLNLQMTHADCPIYTYSTSTRTTSLLTNTSRLLQRRLLSIHSAVSSDIFGLVIHSIGLSQSTPLLNSLRSLLKAHHKKSYTLTVGRINPAKLANFETIECFVLVGCNEGGLVDSKDFLRPIVTPWELVLALKGPEHPWVPGRWTLDISKVLEEAENSGRVVELNGDVRNGDDGNVEERADGDPVFSLVSGTYKSRKIFGGDQPQDAKLREGIKDLTIRNQDFTLAKLESAGSTYLSTRSFQGLEPRYGMDEPAELEQGREGIARGYTDEK